MSYTPSPGDLIFKTASAAPLSWGWSDGAQLCVGAGLGQWTRGEGWLRIPAILTDFTCQESFASVPNPSPYRTLDCAFTSRNTMKRQASSWLHMGPNKTRHLQGMNATGRVDKYHSPENTNPQIAESKYILTNSRKWKENSRYRLDCIQQVKFSNY